MRFQPIPMEERQELQVLCTKEGDHNLYPGDCFSCIYLRHGMEPPITYFFPEEKEYLSKFDTKTNKVFPIANLDPFFQEAV